MEEILDFCSGVGKILCVDWSEPYSDIEDSEDEGSEKHNGDIVDEDGHGDSSSGEDTNGESA